MWNMSDLFKFYALKSVIQQMKGRPSNLKKKKAEIGKVKASTHPF